MADNPAESLKQLRELRGEIKGLEILIRDVSKHTVSDVVSGSSNEFPYQPRTFLVQGADTRRMDRVQLRLIKKKREHEKAVQDAEEFLENVEDAEMRNILRLRYEAGLTWMEIARECDSTENAVRMRAERFLQKFS